MFRMIEDRLHILENGYWIDADWIVQCAREEAPQFFDDDEYPDFLVLQTLFGVEDLNDD